MNSSETLFSRSTPRMEWDATLAERLLHSRFGGPWQRESLLQALIVVQHHFGAIQPAAQQWLARQCQTDCADIRALIHFYHFLEEDDPFPLRIRFSSNIIEQFQGLPSLMDQLHNEARQRAQISTTSCIGLSDQGPSALVNGFPLTALTPHRIRQIAEHLQQGIPLQEWPADWFSVRDRIHQSGPLLDFAPDPGQFLASVRSQTPAKILASITQSGLRGLGGAGFPTGVKWEHCAQTPAEVRHVVCNADEGEPGTFKDRVLLRHNADALLCGMVLCAYAIGATKGYIYLRGEYLFLLDALNQHLQRWRDNHWLDSTFDIEIHLGAGAYICGEETALLESMEGKRGIPRVKPPFPVQQGLHQQPTVVNNVETFVAAAWIAEHGVAAFRKQGTAQSPGTHVHSVSGDCQQPGIYELPFGTSVATLLSLCGATETARVQLGGPSGTMIGPHQFHQPLAYESLSPGGSIMVFDNTRSHWDIARNFTAFFQHESCGFCTPCRAGCQVLHRELQQPPDQHHPLQLRELAQLINTTSHCGLGQTAGRPVLHWLEQEHR